MEGALSPGETNPSISTSESMHRAYSNTIDDAPVIEEKAIWSQQISSGDRYVHGRLTLGDASGSQTTGNELSLSTIISSRGDISNQITFVLPDPPGSSFSRWIRWHSLSSYRRLFAIVLTVNLGVVLGVAVQPPTNVAASFSSNTLTAASVNLAVSVVFRNEHFINMLLYISSSLPISSPLFLRCWFAKIYTYGGIHSGCATAAVTWYIGYTVSITRRVWTPPFVGSETVVMTYVVLLTLLLISVSALPWIRMRLHNWFECIHRFVGWTVIALLWTQTIITARTRDKTVGRVLASHPTFWCLMLITACVIYPWTRLRYYSCLVERLSATVCRVYFHHSSAPYCSAVRIATNPLKETHAFAAIPPRDPIAKEFSVIMSDAGDWTKKFISRLPRKVFVKSGPLSGVLRIAIMFKPVLIVATGSGIGPCLSLFHGAPNLTCHVLWSACDPIRTYGETIVSDVLQADSAAVIVDTAQTGRPDLVQLTYSLFKRKYCEAIVVISNQKVTSKVVREMEMRGVPAYGPIFDS